MRNADTLWYMQLDSKGIVKLIAFNVLKIHKGNSELW